MQMLQSQNTARLSLEETTPSLWLLSCRGNDHGIWCCIGRYIRRVFHLMKSQRNTSRTSSCGTIVKPRGRNHRTEKSDYSDDGNDSSRQAIVW